MSYPVEPPECLDKFLIFGGRGYIGSKIVDLLQKNKENVFISRARLEYREKIEEELDHIRPTYIINCAGVTGTPNVDWCEDHKQKVIRTNVIGTLNLCDVAFERRIHVTNFASGCIYEYDEEHPMNSNRGFKETDTPNFKKSFYSKTKAISDELLQEYPNVLTLRLRMPISDDLHPKSLVTKLIRYQKVIDVPNSVSILPDLLPISIQMTKRRMKGVWNFTNPGTVSHNQILELYKKYLNPSFSWVNFSVEEQERICKAPRSNTMLDTEKLTKEFPEILPAKESLEQIFQSMQKIFLLKQL